MRDGLLGFLWLTNAAFSREDESLQRQVLALLRTWRGALPQEIWFEEIQCLFPDSRHLLPDAQDLELAGRFFVQLLALVERTDRNQENQNICDCQACNHDQTQPSGRR